MELIDETAAQLAVDTADGVAVVEFASGHRHNMWSMTRMRALTAIMRELSESTADAVVLYSGADRSFGVGGDFNETAGFRGGDEVDVWIDHITDLYLACLRVNRPVVAAVDGYAIGIGLQLALTADYRLGSDRCLLQLPEFRVGIACTFGGFMVERTAGRAVMQHMLMSCDAWTAEQSRRDGLLHEIVPPSRLLETARDRALTFARYPAAGMRATKPYLNAEFVAGLERLRDIGKQAHRTAFAAGEAQRNMRRVIDGSR